MNVKQLAYNRAAVIARRKHSGETLENIGLSIGVSGVRVRQILHRRASRMRIEPPCPANGWAYRHPNAIRLWDIQCFQCGLHDDEISRSAARRSGWRIYGTSKLCPRCAFLQKTQDRLYRIKARIGPRRGRWVIEGWPSGSMYSREELQLATHKMYIHPHLCPLCDRPPVSVDDLGWVCQMWDNGTHRALAGELEEWRLRKTRTVLRVPAGMLSPQPPIFIDPHWRRA
jgi:hypothetical protein